MARAVNEVERLVLEVVDIVAKPRIFGNAFGKLLDVRPLLRVFGASCFTFLEESNGNQ